MLIHSKESGLLMLRFDGANLERDILYSGQIPDDAEPKTYDAREQLVVFDSGVLDLKSRQFNPMGLIRGYGSGFIYSVERSGQDGCCVVKRDVRTEAEKWRKRFNHFEEMGPFEIGKRGLYFYVGESIIEVSKEDGSVLRVIGTDNKEMYDYFRRLGVEEQYTSACQRNRIISDSDSVQDNFKFTYRPTQILCLDDYLVVKTNPDLLGGPELLTVNLKTLDTLCLIPRPTVIGVEAPIVGSQSLHFEDAFGVHELQLPILGQGREYNISLTPAIPFDELQSANVIDYSFNWNAPCLDMVGLGASVCFVSEIEEPTWRSYLHCLDPSKPGFVWHNGDIGLIQALSSLDDQHLLLTRNKPHSEGDKSNPMEQVVISVTDGQIVHQEPLDH